MASVTVYGPALSTAVSRVLACLLEKDVDFQLLPVDMAKGQHKSPDFLKLQPFGQVPAFRDGNITLFDIYISSNIRELPIDLKKASAESRAICRYICDKYADKGNKGLMGKGRVEERAWVEQWLEAESQSFNPPTGTLVLQLAFAPRMGWKQDPALIEQNEGKLAKVLDVYEQRLGESRFLAGDEFTLADLSHLPNSHYLVTSTDRGGLITSRKNVGRWWEEISSRDSWKKVVEMQNAPPA